MIKKRQSSHSLLISSAIAIAIHFLILILVKKESFDFSFFKSGKYGKIQGLKIDKINIVRPEEILMLRKVGLKDGAKKDYLQPDMLNLPKPNPKTQSHLSLDNLAAQVPTTAPASSAAESKSKASNSPVNPSAISINSDNSEGAHFYFNPKKQKKIAPSREQDSFKQEAYRNISPSYSNPMSQRLSNFEIRYERPEGVSEDQLNSDEKAYYSFFKRSYANYLSKLYATYEKVSMERPALDRDLLEKHLLIGKIDYDEKGNIITIKILKSSNSDNIHYLFEETLKQLNLPNPPKSFVKTKKQFSTYYQIQIN